MNKKILIVGLTFNEALGTGITIRNLFSKIQSEKIGIVDYSSTNNDFKYANNIFNLALDIKLEANNTNTIKITPYRNKINFINLAYLRIRKYLAYYYNNYSQFRITSNLNKFISAFDPNYIYIVPYNRKVINFALSLNRKFQIPIVLHFMDDFRNRSPKDIFYFFNEYFTIHKIKTIVNRSICHLTICDYMSEEYEHIFNSAFHSFHNPICTNLFSNYSVNSNAKKIEELKVIYAGTIAENNYTTIISFSNICEKLSSSTTKVYFDIYSPHNKTNVFYQRLVKSIHGNSFTNLKDGIPHGEMIATLYKYNLLLLPLSFKQKYRSVIEFSFPTKVAEYMATGIPTLYLIPEGIALYSYVKNNKIGFLLNKMDSSLIENFVLSYIYNSEMRKEDSRAKKLSYESFDIDVVATKFKELFN